MNPTSTKKSGLLHSINWVTIRSASDPELYQFKLMERELLNRITTNPKVMTGKPVIIDVSN